MDQSILVAVLLCCIHLPDYETEMGKICIAVLIFYPNWILKYGTFFPDVSAPERIRKIGEKNIPPLMYL